MSYPGEYQYVRDLGRIPVDEPPESFAVPAVPTQGRFKFEWDLSETRDHSPTYDLLIEWSYEDDEFLLQGVRCRGKIERSYPVGNRPYRVTIPLPAEICGMLARAFRRAYESDVELQNMVKSAAEKQ